MRDPVFRLPLLAPALLHQPDVQVSRRAILPLFSPLPSQPLWLPERELSSAPFVVSLNHQRHVLEDGERGEPSENQIHSVLDVEKEMDLQKLMLQLQLLIRYWLQL